jgi:hypothetical protein
MNLSPKIHGAFGLVLGVLFTYLTWYFARSDGKIHLYLCFLGPGVIPISISLLVLPVEMLIVPKEIDGKQDYNLRWPKYTKLGWLLLGVGLALGGVLFVCLKYGLGL